MTSKKTKTKFLSKMNLVIILEFNKDKIFEQNEFSKFVMQASHTRGDLVDTC